MPLDSPLVATSSEAVPVTGWARDICPSGLGLELSGPLAPGTAFTATTRVPAVSGPPCAIGLAAVVQSCRPNGVYWAIGARIFDCDAEAARRIVEYCYVVSQVERLREGKQLALPAPFPSESVYPAPAPALDHLLAA
jgi:hypothetical protein